MTADTGTAPATRPGSEQAVAEQDAADRQRRAGSGPRPGAGVAAETLDEVSAPLEALLRKRSRRLLGDLLRPHRRAVGLTAAAIVVASVAALAGPWLIGIAIDSGIPPLVKSGDAGPLLEIAALFAVTVVLQSLATRTFVTMTGRFGQAVVLELRRRLFEHMLRLPVAFHESYTSGRVISRQTSDVEAISELFDEGLDGLITAVLSCVLVGTGMLLLDWPLGLVVLSGLRTAGLAVGLVPAQLLGHLPVDQGSERAGHRALRRDVRRAAGGAGVPPREAELRDLRRARRRLRQGAASGPRRSTRSSHRGSR